MSSDASRRRGRVYVPSTGAALSHPTADWRPFDVHSQQQQQQQQQQYRRRQHPRLPGTVSSAGHRLGQQRRRRRHHRGTCRQRNPLWTAFCTVLLLTLASAVGFWIIVVSQVPPTWREHRIHIPVAVPTPVRWLRTAARRALQSLGHGTAFVAISNDEEEETVPSVVVQNHRPVYRDFDRADRTQKRLGVRVPLPIIAVGLPKAGTSSIFQYFTCAGLPSQHWYCCDYQDQAQVGGPGMMSDCLSYNYYRNRYRNDTARHFVSYYHDAIGSVPITRHTTDPTSIFHGCGDYDVYTEINGPRRISGRQPDPTNIRRSKMFLPQHFHLQQIFEAYPNATWILNVRRRPEQLPSRHTSTDDDSPADYKDWAKSVQRHSVNLPLQFANECVYQQKQGAFPSALSVNNTFSFLQEFAWYHSRTVRRFVHRHPSLSFLEVNIANSQAGRQITEFIFGNSNASLETQVVAPGGDVTTHKTVYADCWGRFNINDGKSKPMKGLKRLGDHDDDDDEGVGHDRGELGRDGDVDRQHASHGAAYQRWKANHPRKSHLRRQQP